MALSDPSHGGGARHMGQRIEIDGEHECLTPQSRCSERCFTTGMSRAHNDNLIPVSHLPKSSTFGYDSFITDFRERFVSNMIQSIFPRMNSETECA
jgi:hypothetical protein